MVQRYERELSGDFCPSGLSGAAGKSSLVIIGQLALEFDGVAASGSALLHAPSPSISKLRNDFGPRWATEKIVLPDQLDPKVVTDCRGFGH